MSLKVSPVISAAMAMHVMTARTLQARRLLEELAIVVQEKALTPIQTDVMVRGF